MKENVSLTKYLYNNLLALLENNNVDGANTTT